jgi:serine/threonine protein kinase
MKQIQTINFKSSLLSSEFSAVKTIEIEDIAFDNGAFGEVYFCNSVNSTNFQSSQVLKIFIDDGSGSAKRGYETILKLQDQILKYNTILKQRNEKPLEQVNALGALPQFSFEGVLKGNKVFGYSANLLRKDKWLLFSKLFNEPDLAERKLLLNKFYNLPIDHRLKMAFDIVEGFSHLENMNFIYADLNPANFFVNETDGQLCLIDYEGGAINDSPETFGKPGEWLAPEIQEQLLQNNSQFIQVDLNTDTWAVAIAIHFLIFNFHPLFYLKVRGKKEMSDYFKTQNKKWPNCDKQNFNFRNEMEGVFDKYSNKLKNIISPELVKCFNQTINQGYYNKNSRISYNQWKKALGGLMQPPEIKRFTAHTNIIIDGIPLILTWETEKAYQLIIDNNIGDVSQVSEFQVKPNKNTTYKLTAIGHFGTTEKTFDVTVFPTPLINTINIPTPIFNHQTSISNFKIEAPNIELGIDLNPNIFARNNINFVKLNRTSQKFFLSNKTKLNPISEIFELLQNKIIKKYFH